MYVVGCGYARVLCGVECEVRSDGMPLAGIAMRPELWWRGWGQPVVLGQWVDGHAP